jgi:hypothetical protein
LYVYSVLYCPLPILFPPLQCQSHCFHHQAASAKANRASLVEESAKGKISVRDAARLDRQRKLAEVLRQKADAEEQGEDVERQKNWEWTIEENENWEKKLARKARRADFEFHGGLARYIWVPVAYRFSL